MGLGFRWGLGLWVLGLGFREWGEAFRDGIGPMSPKWPKKNPNPGGAAGTWRRPWTSTWPRGPKVPQLQPNSGISLGEFRLEPGSP